MVLICVASGNFESSEVTDGFLSVFTWFTGFRNEGEKVLGRVKAVFCREAVKELVFVSLR